MNARLMTLPAIAVLLAACAAPADDEATPAATSALEPPAASAPAEAMAESPSPSATADADNAFAFTAQTVDGGTFDGLSIDDTDVVLWFWAPWCPTCQQQARTINEALAEMPEGVQFVGVAGLSDDLQYMKDFVSTFKVDGMTHIADLDGDIYRRFDITQQSTLLFINDNGDAWLAGSGTTADQIVEQAQKLADS